MKNVVNHWLPKLILWSSSWKKNVSWGRRQRRRLKKRKEKWLSLIKPWITSRLNDIKHLRMRKDWLKIWGIWKRRMTDWGETNAKVWMRINRLSIKSLTWKVDWGRRRNKLIREKWNMKDAFKKRMKRRRGSSTYSRSWANRQIDNSNCWSRQMKKDSACSRRFWKVKSTKDRVFKKREIETKW